VLNINNGFCECKDVDAVDIVNLTYSGVKFTDQPLSISCVVMCTQTPRSEVLN